MSRPSFRHLYSGGFSSSQIPNTDIYFRAVYSASAAIESTAILGTFKPEDSAEKMAVLAKSLRRLAFSFMQNGLLPEARHIHQMSLHANQCARRCHIRSKKCTLS